MTYYTLIEHDGAHIYVEGDEVASTDLDPARARVIEDGIRDLPEGASSVSTLDLPRDVWRYVPEDDRCEYHRRGGTGPCSSCEVD